MTKHSGHNTMKMYAFGKNWRRYHKKIDESKVQLATLALKELVGLKSLESLSFLDVGSGSGIHSLSALRLGCNLTAFDYDIDSVSTTKDTVSSFSHGGRIDSIAQGSALDALFLESLGTFDIVYSWGVLHHTGDLWRAMTNIAKYNTKKGSLLVIALYSPTLLDPFWKTFKPFYASCSRSIQNLIVAVYKFLTLPYLLRRHDKQLPRGMDLDIDIDDWLGGFPYESASPTEVIQTLSRFGFELQRANTKRRYFYPSSGCDEFVFVRVK